MIAANPLGACGMGLNGLKSWQGKTLKQWTADIAKFCKGSGERSCSGTDSIETLQWKMEMNWRCLLARSAVQYFYSPPQTTEEKRLDETHKQAIREAAAAYDNCHRLLMIKYREEFNVIKKAFNMIQVAQEQEKRAQKSDEKKSKKEWASIVESLHSDTIKLAIDKKSGELDFGKLKKQTTVLEKMQKTAAT